MPIERLVLPKRLDEEKLEALRELFPDVFSDGRIVFERLKDELAEALDEVDAGDEHYGLNWPGKKQAKKVAVMPPSGTLAPSPGEGLNEATTENCIIEGDNLEVLRILRKSYAGRIKLIYIDPPYNTGNDFVYRDDFSDPIERYLELTGQAASEGLYTTNPKTGGRFHSNWLNMMYPRLRVARDLMSNDGAIFISIDDNEVTNLRAIMDEIFGSENFLAIVCWQKRYAPSNDKTDFSATHEYLIAYAKSRKYSETGRSLALLNKLSRTEEQNKVYKNPDNDPRGLWRPDNYTCNKNADQRPNLYYPIIHPKTGEEIWPNRNRVWSYSKEKHEENVKNGLLWWGLTQENKVPAFKRFLADVGGIIANTWWSFDEVGHNDEAKKEFHALFPEAGDAFDTPKPTRLMRRILELGTDSNGEQLVLDFFAGSGTLGQAVLEANAADDGRRRFLLVQVPEPTAAGSRAREAGLLTLSDITKERLRRAAAKLSSQAVHSGVGFKVYKLSPTNVRAWRNYDGNQVVELENLFSSLQSPLVDGWEPTHLLVELMLREGYPLDSGIEQLASFPENRVWQVTHPELGTNLLVCLDDRIKADTVNRLDDHVEDVFVCLDTALHDQLKLQIADRTKIETI